MSHDPVWVFIRNHAILQMGREQIFENQLKCMGTASSVLCLLRGCKLEVLLQFVYLESVKFSSESVLTDISKD